LSEIIGVIAIDGGGAMLSLPSVLLAAAGKRIIYQTMCLVYMMNVSFSGAKNKNEK
jgi:hypothetical protein